MVCLPFTQLKTVPYSHWFWNMPALPKLVLGPNSRPSWIVGSDVVIPICGNVLDPSRFIPTELGLNGCEVSAYARRRVNPTCCCQVRAGDSDSVFAIVATWLPAFNRCANPSSEPTAPKGFVVGSF